MQIFLKKLGLIMCTVGNFTEVLKILLSTLTAFAGVRFYVRLSVCLSVFPHDISKTDAARITERDTEMLHDECWKYIYFGILESKGQRLRSRHESQNIACVGL